MGHVIIEFKELPSFVVENDEIGNEKKIWYKRDDSFKIRQQLLIHHTNKNSKNNFGQISLA